MSFTAEQIESSAPDAWTGKSTSVVYEDLADAESWLLSRGLTAFAGADDATQTQAFIVATEDAEDSIRGHFRGRPVQQNQGLLLPARGAYDSRGHVLLSSGDLETERSVRLYLEGIRLLAEEIARGTYLPLAETGADVVKSESTRRGRVEYRDGVSLNSLSANHPKSWSRIRALIPQMT